MRKIQFEQGSEDWLKWRRGLLTATDAPMLMGASPYVTPYQGWKRKLSLIPEQKSNPAMQRGIRDEPIARKMFIDQYGINMTPCCIESEKYNFLGASLDGINDHGNLILEIKSQNIQNIKDRGIPEFHMMQMQHQMLCSDGQVSKCFYCSIWDHQIYTLDVYADEAWFNEYIPKAREYWKSVVLFDPPDLSPKDYKDMTDNVSWSEYSEAYISVSYKIKNLEKIKEEYKKELIKMCGDDSCMGYGLKVMKKVVKGRVDYESIPDLSNIDLDKYRKPTSDCWTITLDKKDKI